MIKNNVACFLFFLLLTGYGYSLKNLKSGREGMFIIDTVAVYVSAPYDQKSSAIAFDGTNFLVVWEDLRSSSNSDIIAARISQSGAVLEPSGIVVSSAPDNQSTPSVAFDGTNYLVVWKDSRNGNADIYGARINPSGNVLDSNGIPISLATNSQSNPAIAFDGTNYLVVWDDSRIGTTYTDIYGARVSPSGILIDTNGIAISTATLNQSNPVVAFDGTNYMIVWQDNRYDLGWDIYGARVTPSGTVLEPNGIEISYESGYQWYPAISFDGANYLVVWGDRRSGTREDIYGARITPAGTVLDPGGFAISTYAQNGQYFPSVAFCGLNYLVVWDDYRSTTHNIYGARVTPSGSVLDPNGRLVSSAARDQLYPAIAFGDTNYFVVWDDYRTNLDFDIYGARVDTSASCLDPNGILLSSTINFQLAPAVSYDGTNYLVVWEDAITISYYNIRGARVNSSGMVLDVPCINISTATNDQMSPAISFDGTNYLVVWEDARTSSYTDIYGTRVSQSGSVLNPAGIAISTAANTQESPGVAFGDTNYFVVWQDKRGGTYYDIYGTRVNPAGTVLNPTGIVISNAANNQVEPAIEFDGTNFLVVWSDYRNGTTPDIYCTRVAQSGSVLNPNGIVISNASGDQMTPSVAFGGTNYLVVWVDNRNGNWDIYGARITPAGTVLDPNGIPICTNSSTQMSPAVAFDGMYFVVVWQDTRNGGFDIYGAAVNQSGAIVHNFAVSTQAGNQIDPALAIGSDGQIFSVYSGFTDFINNKPVNTMRIWGTLYVLIGVEERNHDLSLPKNAMLNQNAPNPFYNFTELNYRVIKDNIMSTLKVYDSQGKLIKILDSGIKTKGVYYLKWDGTDEKGRKVPSGIYFCELCAGDGVELKKMVLLK